MVLVEWFEAEELFVRCSSPNILRRFFFFILHSFLSLRLSFGSSNIFFGIFTPFYYLFIICFTFFFTFCLSKRSSKMWIKRNLCRWFYASFMLLWSWCCCCWFGNMLLVYFYRMGSTTKQRRRKYRNSSSSQHPH